MIMMNFSPYIFVLPEKYVSNDEREIEEELEEIEKENDYEPLY